MIIKALREGLGRVIVFGSYITLPKKVNRSTDEQAAVARRVAGMALYQFYACPFCVMVRREIHRLNLPIETRDIKHDKNRQELLKFGGKVQAPCLRIEENGESTYLYDSKVIVEFLKKSFDPAAEPELLKSN